MRIVQGVFKNTSRAFEVSQPWTPPRQPWAWHRRARSLPFSAQEHRVGGPHPGRPAAPLRHGPLAPCLLIICVTASYTQGWPKHQGFILRNRRKRKMGSALRILIKVQSSTFVSCLIFKMSLEDTSAQHQSAFSVTFLFWLVTCSADGMFSSITWSHSDFVSV